MSEQLQTDLEIVLSIIYDIGGKNTHIILNLKLYCPACHSGESGKKDLLCYEQVMLPHCRGTFVKKAMVFRPKFLRFISGC